MGGRTGDAQKQVPSAPNVVKDDYLVEAGAPGAGFVEWDFEISLEKRHAADAIGITISLHEEKFLLITEIQNSGLIPAWNHSNDNAPHVKVNKGDFIVAVNGLSGDINLMRAELKDKKNLTLWVKRAQSLEIPAVKGDYKITLERSSDAEKICALLKSPKKRTFKINDVQNNGLVSAWNEQNLNNPEVQVKPGDLIVAVNLMEKSADLWLKRATPRGSPRKQVASTPESTEEGNPRSEVVPSLSGMVPLSRAAGADDELSVAVPMDLNEPRVAGTEDQVRGCSFITCLTPRC